MPKAKTKPAAGGSSGRRSGRRSTPNDDPPVEEVEADVEEQPAGPSFADFLPQPDSTFNHPNLIKRYSRTLTIGLSVTMSLCVFAVQLSMACRITRDAKRDANNAMSPVQSTLAEIQQGK